MLSSKVASSPPIIRSVISFIICSFKTYVCHVPEWGVYATVAADGFLGTVMRSVVSVRNIVAKRKATRSFHVDKIDIGSRDEERRDLLSQPHA